MVLSVQMVVGCLSAAPGIAFAPLQELCRTGRVPRNTKFIGRSDQLMGQISARNRAAAASGSLGGPAVEVGSEGSEHAGNFGT